MSLVQVFEGRPSVVANNGWTVYVSVRDAAYLQTKRDWKRKLAAAHPDRGGAHDAFLAVHQAYTDWHTVAAAEYEVLGLLPPDMGGAFSATDRPRKGYANMTCEGCRQVFTVERCRVARRRYCSRLCKSWCRTKRAKEGGAR